MRSMRWIGRMGSKEGRATWNDLKDDKHQIPSGAAHVCVCVCVCVCVPFGVYAALVFTLKMIFPIMMVD